MSKKVNSTISTVDEPIFTKFSKMSTPLNAPSTPIDVTNSEPIISNTSEPVLSQVEPSSNRNWLMYGIIGVVILVVLGLLGFGIYMLVKEYKDKKKEESKPAPPIKSPPKEEDEIPSIINPVKPTPKPKGGKGKQPNDLIGILVSNEKDREPLFFPLHGRKIAGKGEDMWYYYTKVADIVTPIISKDVECGAKAGCKEMGNNTIVVLKQFPNRKFTAKLYKKRGPEYASQRPYEYLGMLVSEPKGKVPLRLPLYGRELTHRENRWQYYTKVKEVMLPMFYKGRDCQEDVGCDELNHGSTLTLDGYGTRVFTVQIKGKQPIRIQPINPPSQNPTQKPTRNAIDILGMNIDTTNKDVLTLFTAIQGIVSTIQKESCIASKETIDNFKKSIINSLSKVSCSEFKNAIQKDIEKAKVTLQESDMKNKQELLQDLDNMTTTIDTIMKVICVNNKVDTTKLKTLLDLLFNTLCSDENIPYTGEVLNNRVGINYYKYDADKEMMGIVMTVLTTIQKHISLSQKEMCKSISKEEAVNIFHQDLVNILKANNITSMTDVPCDKVKEIFRNNFNTLLNTQVKNPNPQVKINVNKYVDSFINYSCVNGKFNFEKAKAYYGEVYDAMCKLYK